MSETRVLSEGARGEVAGKRQLRRRVTFQEVVGAVEELKWEAWPPAGTPGDGTPLTG